MKRPWFRMHARVATDAKVQRLPPKLFKAWVNLCCLACENGGYLPSLESIAFILHTSAERSLNIISKLTEHPFNLIDCDSENQLKMHDWDEWQYQSDVSTERVRKYRASKDPSQGNVSETLHETNGNVSETDQRQRQRQNTEKAYSPPTPSHISEPKPARFSRAWCAVAFTEFWGECVWAKIGVAAARKAYEKKALTPELAAKINAAAKEQGPGILQRAAIGGISVLHPATWLNQERYLDEQLPLCAVPTARGDLYERRQQVQDETFERIMAKEIQWANSPKAI